MDAAKPLSPIEKQKVIANQILQWSENIPNRHLKLQNGTSDQIKTYWAIHDEVILLCESLKARFTDGGNPLMKRHKAKELSKFDYEIMMAWTDLFQTKWNLIQAGWEYIADARSSELIDGMSDINMYHLVIEDWFNARWLKTDEYYEITLKETEQRLREVRDCGWKHDLSQITIETKHPGPLPSRFINIVRLLGRHPEDNSIQNLIRDYASKLANLSDIQYREVEKVRKGKSRRLQSEQWINGNCKVFRNGKWRDKFT